MTTRGPVAPLVHHETHVHGDTIVDPYFWLREKSNPAVRAYLEAENTYAEQFMAPLKPFEESLYQEMLARIKETDVSVPYRRGQYRYYVRTEQGRQYPTLCRRRLDPEAPEEITLDLNQLAQGHKYLGRGVHQVSDNDELLAYSLDFTGFRQYTLYIKNLQSGEVLPDRAEKVGSVAWAADNRTVFYTAEDEAKRQYRVYRHVLGQDASSDTLIFEETDELYRIWLGRSLDRRYLFIISASSETSETRIIPCDAPESEPRLLLPRENEHEYYATHHNGLLYIRTNRGAANFRVVTAPVTQPDIQNWTEFIPHNPDVMIEDIELFEKYAVVSERESGLPNLRVIRLADGASHRIATPEPVYSLAEINNQEFTAGSIHIQYQSFITPPSVFEYDLETRQRTLLKETEVLGGYDRELYVSERLSVEAADGTRIPVSLVRKRDTPLDGSAPLLLYGYGSYGISIPVTFSSSRLSLLNRGVIYAVAHVRGGGELGEPWHDAGKMMVKKNTFTDFITVAERLIAMRYTSPQRLIAQGGSAGGLLMGAIANMRPELFHAIVSHVPFVDVIQTMLDSSLPLTVGEYLEWGNPNVEAEYRYMKSYCPYLNLEARAYPHMLIKTSLNDSQVMYWEPAKYVARLRTLKTDDHLLLLHTNLDAGHSGASGRYDALRELAFDFTYVLGIADRAV